MGKCGGVGQSVALCDPSSSVNLGDVRPLYTISLAHAPPQVAVLPLALHSLIVSPAPSLELPDACASSIPILLSPFLAPDHTLPIPTFTSTLPLLGHL